MTSKLANVLIGNQFRLQSKIGAGSFGEIFLGVNERTKEDVAIKLESALTQHPQLIYEAKVLSYVKNNSGIPAHGLPKVHWYGQEADYNIMVLDLLGPSLEDLFNYCNRKFSLKTTLMLAIQLIERFEYLHQRCFVHRDIKADNFLMGLKQDSHILFVVDFGLAKKFYDNRTKTHIPYRNNKSLTGTARYASIHAH